MASNAACKSRSSCQLLLGIEQLLFFFVKLHGRWFLIPYTLECCFSFSHLRQVRLEVWQHLQGHLVESQVVCCQARSIMASQSEVCCGQPVLINWARRPQCIDCIFVTIDRSFMNCVPVDWIECYLVIQQKFRNT